MKLTVWMFQVLWSAFGQLETTWWFDALCQSDLFSDLHYWELKEDILECCDGNAGTHFKQGMAHND